MLFQNISEKEWRDVFLKKMSGFVKKSPVLLSFNVVSNMGKAGVIVTHVNSGTTYFFEFAYDEQVKDFIARVKAKLVENHYPRLIEELWNKKELTTQEIAARIQSGKSVDEVGTSEVVRIGTRIYRLDRIITYRNIALLVLEQSDVPGDELGAITRYQYSGSLVVFLKKYRDNKFKSLEEASNDFFLNSILIDQLRSARDDDNKENEDE